MVKVAAIVLCLCVLGVSIATIFEIKAQRELDDCRQLLVCREAAIYDASVTCSSE